MAEVDICPGCDELNNLPERVEDIEGAQGAAAHDEAQTFEHNLRVDLLEVLSQHFGEPRGNLALSGGNLYVSIYEAPSQHPDLLQPSLRYVPAHPVVKVEITPRPPTLTWEERKNSRAEAAMQVLREALTKAVALEGWSVVEDTPPYSNDAFVLRLSPPARA